MFFPGAMWYEIIYILSTFSSTQPFNFLFFTTYLPRINSCLQIIFRLFKVQSTITVPFSCYKKQHLMIQIIIILFKCFIFVFMLQMHIPSIYTALRKTTWGGLFPVLQDDMVRAYIHTFVRADVHIFVHADIL